MAAYTSYLAGNWSVAGNWKDSGGVISTVVPGAGDTVILTKSMTVNVNTIIGASNGQYVSGTTPAAIQLNSGGRLVISAGIKFTIRGDMTINTGYNTAAVGVTMAAGAIFEFDSSQYASPFAAASQCRFMNLTTSNQPGFSFICNGTLASPCYIQSNAGGISGRIFANGYSSCGGLTATYTYFVRLGTSTQNMWEVGQNVTAGVVSCTNCTFDTCGVFHSAAQAAAAGYTSFSNCNWINSVSTTVNVDLSQYAVYTNCSFDLQGPLTTNVYVGLQMNTFYSGGGFSATATTGSWTLVTNGFIRILNVLGFSTGGDMSKIYLCVDHNQQNPHYMACNKNYSHTFSDFIIETTDQDGQGDYFMSPVDLPITTVAKTYYFKRTLVLPNALGDCSGCVTLFGASASSSVITMDYQNGTYICGTQGVNVGETGTSPVAGQFSALKNNIVWDFEWVSPRGWIFYDDGHYNLTAVQARGYPNNDILPPEAGDYNTHFQTLDSKPSIPWYYHQGRSYIAAFSATPGAHDFAADPQFVDRERVLVNFDSKYLGNVAGSTWASHADTDQFNVGDLVSNNNIKYYAWMKNNVINFRCIQAHTKNTVGSEPGSIDPTGNTNRSGNWRNYWEIASLYRLRVGVARGAAGPPLTFTDASLGLVNADMITTLRTWISKGYCSQNTSMRGAASDGGDIGAFPVVGASQNLSLLGCG